MAEFDLPPSMRPTATESTSWSGGTESLASSSAEDLTEILWRRGDLSHLLRPHGQHRAYGFIHRFTETRPHDMGPVVINCDRRMGKSFLLVALAIERCLRLPRQVVRYGSPTFVQTDEIVQPLIRQILDSCP